MAGTESYDITERTERKELIKNRNMLQSLLNTLPHSVYFKDRDGRLIQVSRYFLRLTAGKPPIAKSADEVIGKTDFDLFPEWLAKATAEDEKHIIETGEPIIDKEERSLAPNGSGIYLSTTKAPLLDEKGDVIGIVGITRDITEQKKAIINQIEAEKEAAAKRASAEAAARVAATISEAAQRYKDTIDELKQAQKKLTEESNLFQNFLDSIPVIIFIKDKDGRFIRVSKLYHALHPESMIGKTVFDLYPEDQARAATEGDKRVMETGKPIIDEERYEAAPDGSKHYVLITKAPLFDKNGNIVGIVGITREKT